MSIAREEIFGPVLSILPYEDEEDAIRIANDSVYGLAGGVWSGDEDHALRVARRLRTGQVEINGGAFNPKAPFGGYKQSGVGASRSSMANSGQLATARRARSSWPGGTVPSPTSVALPKSSTSNRSGASA
jgi:acyl-CoA reductase-like NAD-dependent aldehyde dehydrogenase